MWILLQLFAVTSVILYVTGREDGLVKPLKCRPLVENKPFDSEQREDDITSEERNLHSRDNDPTCSDFFCPIRNLSKWDAVRASSVLWSSSSLKVANVHEDSSSNQLTYCGEYEGPCQKLGSADIRQVDGKYPRVPLHSKSSVDPKVDDIDLRRRTKDGSQENSATPYEIVSEEATDTKSETTDGLQVEKSVFSWILYPVRLVVYFNVSGVDLNNWKAFFDDKISFHIVHTHEMIELLLRILERGHHYLRHNYPLMSALTFEIFLLLLIFFSIRKLFLRKPANNDKDKEIEQHLIHLQKSVLSIRKQLESISKKKVLVTEPETDGSIELPELKKQMTEIIRQKELLVSLNSRVVELQEQLFGISVGTDYVRCFQEELEGTNLLSTVGSRIKPDMIDETDIACHTKEDESHIAANLRDDLETLHMIRSPSPLGPKVIEEVTSDQIAAVVESGNENISRTPSSFFSSFESKKRTANSFFGKTTEPPTVNNTVSSTASNSAKKDLADCIPLEFNNQQKVAPPLSPFGDNRLPNKTTNPIPKSVLKNSPNFFYGV